MGKTMYVVMMRYVCLGQGEADVAICDGCAYASKKDARKAMAEAVKYAMDGHKDAENDVRKRKEGDCVIITEVDGYFTEEYYIVKLTMKGGK